MNNLKNRTKEGNSTKFMDILKYWGNSLADADKLDPDFDKRRSEGLLISYSEIESGKISTEILDRFISKFSDGKKRIFEVLLCPMVAIYKKEHGSKKRSKMSEAIVPLWIPSLLDLSGNLIPHPRFIPWISRDYLEPCESDFVSIGSINQVDEYLSSNTINTERWNDCLAFAKDMFKFVTGMQIHEFVHDQYQISDECFLLSNDVIVGVSKKIQELYSHIEDNNIQSLLLSRFANLENNNPQTPLMDIDSDKLSENHYGQMSNQFSLSHSQRQAMHHTTLLDNGELIAINGPPGTGKTTLLQSIVATAVIDRALHRTDPPIIVVSSTNNNAVTNVIESFGKINEMIEDNLLAGRWIPDLPSYGAYLKSSFKNDENKPGWLTVTKDNTGGAGFFDKFENQDYLMQASLYYLERCSEYASEDLQDVPNAIELLHSHLENKVRQIQEVVQANAAYRELDSLINEKYPSGIENVIRGLKDREQQLNGVLAKLKALNTTWKKYLLEEKWWIPLLLRLPFIKSIAVRKKQLRNEYFCSNNRLPEFDEEDEINKWFRNQHEIIVNEKNAILNYLSDVTEELETLLHAKQQWENIESLLPINDGETYLDCLDRTYRYEAFKLAVHYWEGEWLIETERMLADPTYKRNNGRQGLTLLWRRLAKITPCFVTTLYMLPSFFSAWEQKTFPLYDYIDTLIIDEAGQVVPEVAGASFALAKKAIIVGDTKQIQPVWKIPVSVDVGNLKLYGIHTEVTPSDKLFDTGILASSGSVMEVARRQTKFSVTKADGGLWLTEHRRCVPEIISYCNELAYHGKLQPKRNSIKDYFLPHMGYAHIPGNSGKRGGSLENRFEAEVIVSWIDRNKDKILEAYAKEGVSRIEDVVAIITPFAPQKRLLLNLLKSAGLKNIKAGTVHTLQGDERPIVIFSPVYDNNHSSKYFFDLSESMLNVAVSRARDSFLVFGNMGIFSPDSALPSGLLAKYLFATEDNEIKNVDLGPYFKTRYGMPPVQHIHELEHHREMLRNCIQSANKEITIVSPFLSSVAIKADQLEELFDEASKRGVRVTVYTDEALNFFRKNLKANYIKAKQILDDHGVQLNLTKRVHSKALWVDSNVLVEGSFNWLSAVRNPKSQWCRFETSLVYRGSHVAEMISKISEDLESRKVINLST